MEHRHPQDRSLRSVAIWLLAMACLVALMVAVGGATRLTDSGLSITQWDLVMGTLPPLSPGDWQEAFALYQEIPEYDRVNRGMSLEEFKFIYWWEWGHRNLGRFIGLAFLLPLIFFWATGRARGALGLRLLGLFALICLQGAIGWYMVSSGLSERVDVSQYRLALHLSTALILFGLIIWQALALLRPRGFRRPPGGGLGSLAGLFLAAASVQIVLGAFVAGLRAGSSYNTWPLMDGRLVPAGYFGAEPQLADLFERVEAVQFNHRMMAFVVLGFALVFAMRAFRAGRAPEGAVVLGAVLLQAAFGIWALLAAVPLWLGLVHQLGALAVLGAGIWSLYALSAARPQVPAMRQAFALQG